MVALTFALKLLGDFLLKNQGFQSIITLLLSARETKSKTSNVILLCVDEAGKAAILTLVSFDLDLELGGLFCKLLSKRLEFEELNRISNDLVIKSTVIDPTCCFQVSNSSTKKLLRLVTLDSSVSMRPLRLMKSCQASTVSREYWLRSRTISFKCLMETLVMSGFLTEPPKMAFIPVLRP